MRSSVSLWPLGIRCQWHLADGTVRVVEPDHGLATLLALTAVSIAGALIARRKERRRDFRA